MVAVNPKKTPRPGLLIVDHGTRSAAANAPLAELARSLSEARPAWLVEHAHMELAEPTFDGAVDRLVAKGAEEILIHLHFLGDGFHVRETLPQLIEKARARHPEISIRSTSPLGTDPRIAEIILGRMDAQPGSDRPR
ncbi:MAG: CbiX/SirB N-terminal domain-containing protein [Myxococcota bacterium]